MSKYSRKVYFTFSWAPRGADERCGVVALRPVASTRVQGRGDRDEPCEPTVRLPD